jgi:trehalose 6-phosphate synthase/phosphatase
MRKKFVGSKERAPVRAIDHKVAVQSIKPFHMKTRLRGDNRMSRTIIVSNRLPVTVSNDSGVFEYKKSIGGLSTGLKSVHEQSDSIWVGWPGISEDSFTDGEKDEAAKKLKEEFACCPVRLSEREVENYYHKFCNSTIWPLFHYFMARTQYDTDSWNAYRSVNEKFLMVVERFLDDNSKVWIHDYQLMLLPRMIKEKYPHVQVGFFLHIPFPSAEIFRLLIWREEILSGMLGADLIGFHTYDYVRHFLSSTRRILGIENSFNKIAYEDRQVAVDAFPMGIDYNRFSKKSDENKVEANLEGRVDTKEGKIILSVDRLDYTKGIPHRIRAFNRFLALFPEYCGRVCMHLIVAPSRVEVDSYGALLREINQEVSKTNGKYGTMNWMPVWFFFRSFDQKELILHYRSADVLLVTPLRDGMNLVAKEYIASRYDFGGMPVISETAGAASELPEAVIVNVNDIDAIANGIKTALEMPEAEKASRNKMMHKRLRRYDVEFWAKEFLNALDRATTDSANDYPAIRLDREGAGIEEAYRIAKKRLIMLDYDGTLVGFQVRPEMAQPDEQLRELLARLSKDPKNTVVLISGRAKGDLEGWFGKTKRIHLVAAHGLWVRIAGQHGWTRTVPLDNTWKEPLRPIMELYADRMPGSWVEEKDDSIALHYRKCDPDMVNARLPEVRDTVLSMTQSTTLALLDGNRVLEIKDSRVSKGTAASRLQNRDDYDFILGAGDDYTDEDLFLSLPQEAFSIKVGAGKTAAVYRLKSWKAMRGLLKQLAEN